MTQVEGYRALFDTIDDGVFVIEFLDGPEGPLSDYRHVEGNRAFRRHSGLSDAIGRTAREVVPDEAERWIAIYRKVLETGEPVRFTRLLEATNHHLEVAAARMEPASLRRIVVSFKDVTARVRAEEALQRSEAKLRELNASLERRVEERTAELRLYRDIIQANASPVCAFDTDYRLIAFNQAHSDEFFRIFGRRVALGDVFPDLFPSEQGAVMRSLMARALSGEVYTVFEEFGDPDLAKPVWEVSYTPLRDDAGRIVGAFHQAKDVSDRMRAEAALGVSQAALRQSQKMEAVGQLTSGLAHDFNNLLAGILGSLEMIQTRLQQGRMSEIGRYTLVAQDAASRAAALTHRLLAFSRRQTLSPKPTDVNRLVDDMVELIRRTVGPAIQIHCTTQVDLLSTLVDPNQLENALLNLCINARDAMPDGGRITIRTALLSPENEDAANLDLAAGSYVVLSVSDTGNGMSPDVIEKAFDPFFTTKPIGVGTGLGLSMIYGFARQSGGQVRIASPPGEGATVQIYLPAHDTPEVRDVHETPPTMIEADGNKTVLVVDDEPIVRMLIVDAVEDLGYTPIEAIDGPEAMAVLRSDTPIDFLITDVGLPNGMNGRQVADAARELRPGLQVLFVTGYAETSVLSHGQLGPGMQILTKPFTLTTLMERIQGMLAD
ncbi:PAS domain-containing sensor histidine kinase [Aureimonas sp. AU4]|uniref:hybrid sensor histidine kinase/response regulator n=1 Tax=Aureimonas sp. AU4 TaxID=1638163 RepID=UPI000782E65F|nr:PAS domain-containing protein [Aureimonas sp. AU4]